MSSPRELEEARSHQAERKRQPRVLLSESENQIVRSFFKALLAYANNSFALHLQVINLLFEGVKEISALIIAPTCVVDTPNLGGLSGVIAIAQNSLDSSS